MAADVAPDPGDSPERTSARTDETVDGWIRAADLASDVERERARAILERIGESEGTACPGCARPLVGQEVVESVVLGHQDAPHCHRCLAAEYDESPAAFLDRVREYVDRVGCFRETWRWCAERGGTIEEEFDDA